MDSDGVRLHLLHLRRRCCPPSPSCSTTVVIPLLQLSNWASRGNNVVRSGEGAAALHLNPFLYESKYVIKNLLTLFVSDLELFPYTGCCFN